MKKRISLALATVFTMTALAIPAAASAEILLLDPCYFKDGTPKEKLKCN